MDGSKELVPPRRLLLVPDARADEAEDEGEAYEDEEEETVGNSAAKPRADEDDDDDFEDFDGDEEEVATEEPPPAAAERPGSGSASSLQTSCGDDDDEEDGGDAAFAVMEGDCPADHAYAATAANGVALKEVRRLWSQLGKSLPAGVTVRAFGARSDVLRCLIVGPCDTPYERQLFVFDLQLPAAYPREPPAMHYHAHGIAERLNPNLYENGKVCLSLLGTWSGPGWDPESSTMLQLLVSVQGLVLVDKPYYNEPGNEKHANTVEGEQQARLYNENARLLSIQGTIQILRRAPKPLRGAIKHHLAQNAEPMLQQLRHAAADDAANDDLAQKNAFSDGFRRVLRRLLPNLRRALTNFGIQLQPEQQV